jgi:Cu(I)/Ag(I) efflux system membrane fusion protein
MKTNRNIASLLLLPVLLAAAGLAASCSRPADPHADRAGAPAEKKKDVYYCPMHPTYRSDRPGNCPICNMKLVLLKDEAPPPAVSHEEHERLTGEKHVPDHAAAALSPDKRALIGVRTAAVEKRELKRVLREPARVVYDRELYDAQIEYLREYRIAQGTLRKRELAFVNLVDSRWEAPRIDIAKSKLLLMGMDEESLDALVKAAKADETLLYISPTGEVWVYAEVFEYEAASVRKGDRVRLDVHAVPGKAYEAPVHSVASIVDPMTRRVRVRIRVRNDGFLKPGMYATAAIETEIGEVLSVPEEAVVHTGERDLVFVEAAEGAFEPRAVELGAKGGEFFEVRSGLAEGERVSVAGNFMLDSESRLKAAFQGAGGEGGGGGHVHGS